MKKLLMILAVATLYVPARAQVTVDSSYANSHYRQRLAFFRAMPDQRNEIVFLGNSITEAGEWQELLPGRPVVNRGISGDVTFGVLARLDEVTSSKPAKIFLLIGVNDLKRGISVDMIVNNYRRIIANIQAASPKTRIYLQSVLPVNEGMLSPAYDKVKNSIIAGLNEQLQQVAQQPRVTYINLHPLMEDATGQLKKELTPDGIHLYPSAYIGWTAALKKYLQKNP